MLTIGDALVLEGNAGTQNALVTVSLTEPHGNNVTVNYATADGTANSNDDYLARSGTLSFAPGETSTVINVPILGNLEAPGDLDFTVALSAPTGAAV